MCGIVGYVGKRSALNIIIDALKRLEYRGYDSAGVGLIYEGKLFIRKTKGKITDLEKLLSSEKIDATTGIGHTRWATHGKPTDENAHPHVSNHIAVVHNGIIENYMDIKEDLIKKGYKFKSDTDTEVIAALIHDNYKDSLKEAVINATKRLIGSFAIAVISEKEPSTIVGYRKDSPLILGIGNGEYILSSDIPAILPYTNKIITIEDNECIVITTEGYEIIKNGESVQKETVTVNWSPILAEKAGYKHFMQKEIFEQPRAISDTIQGLYSFDRHDFFIFDENIVDKLSSINSIKLIACGTSFHACLVAKYWLEKFAKIQIEVDIASEFRYRDVFIDDKTACIFVSQSGETADTLAALRKSKKEGAITLSICNVMGSSIARESDAVIYTHAGPEIGVASTKAFTSQLAVLFTLSLFFGKLRKNMSTQEVDRYYSELLKIPRLMEDVLQLDEHMEVLAKVFMNKHSFLYLGRYLSYPIALEGALKLKEISYIHAEGYPAGEMKHGPIALIDEEMPVVIIAPKDRVYEKILGNVEEVKARDGIVIAFTEEKEEKISKKADYTFYLPKVPEELNPFLYVIPLQLFAYHVAARKGYDVDQPRNLAKAVTVE